MTKYSNQIGESFAPWYYEMHEIGYNYRITDIQSAMGSCQLKNWSDLFSKGARFQKNMINFWPMLNTLKSQKLIV